MVKAMLIHGADAMGGSSEPDGDRGFGRIHLEAAMPFEGEELWALYVEDDDGSPTSLGQVNRERVCTRLCVRVHSDVCVSICAPGSLFEHLEVVAPWW